MKKATNLIDTALWHFLTKAVDLLILSLWWLLGSLPIVTLGASFAALYQSVHKTIWHDEAYPTQVFWKSYKENLKQGVLITLTILPAAAFAVYAWLFAGYVGKESFLGAFYQVVSIVTGLVIVCVSLYIFPVISRYSLRYKEAFLSAFALPAVRPGATLILLVLEGVCVFGILLMPTVIIVMPGLFAFAEERLMEPALDKLHPKDEKTGENHEKV